MKTYAHHDANGVIKSIITFQAPDTAGLMLTPTKGELVSELSEVSFKSKTPDFEELSEIARTYVVSEPLRKSGLKKKG